MQEGADFWEIKTQGLSLQLSITPLRCEGSDEIRGTGIFFQKNKRFFIVTCYHVIKSCAGDKVQNWSAIVHKKGKKNNTVLKREFRTLKFKVPDDVLFCPNQDIAAIEFKQADDMIFHAFQSTQIANDEHLQKLGIHLGSVITMIGYPEGFSDTVQQLPVTRVGYIAFDPYLGWKGEDLGVVNMNVYKGDSGSPVILSFVEQVIEASPPAKKGLPPSSIMVKNFQDFRLLGIHGGGYSKSSNPIAMGIYYKLDQLLDNIFEWDKMINLKSFGFQHPRITESVNELHNSGFIQSEQFKVTTLDKKIFELLSSSESTTLLEVERCLNWKFMFDENGGLSKLFLGYEEYKRTDSERYGGKCEEKCLRFFRMIDSEKYDGVFIFNSIENENERDDGLIVFGHRYEEMELEEDLPMYDNPIRWKKI